MASSAVSNLSINRPPLPSSFWARESPSLKQGIKTGLAGTITYAIYTHWNLPQGYWAVFAALVVTQANVGASWKAGLYRTVGSTCGALAAALLLPLMGNGSKRAGIALFLLASFFAYLTALHPSFSAAGFTAALILVFGGLQEPWHMAWLRVAYTLLGALVAFAISALVWPVHARVVLRSQIANLLQAGGAVYDAITAAALHGADNERQVLELDRSLLEVRRGITQQLEEARSEWRFTRFSQSGFQAFVDQADQIRRRLTAMAEDRSLYVQAGLRPEILPSLPALAESTARAFSDLAAAVRARQTKLIASANLQIAIRNLDDDLARLREQRATAPFSLDRMLPFWSFAFNLREIAQDLCQLESLVQPLAQ